MFSILTLLFTLSLNVVPPEEHPQPSPPAEEVRLAGLALRLAGEIGPEIFPQFSAHSAPIILVAGEHEFLLNTTGGVPGFEPLDLTFRDRPVLVRPRIFSPQIEAAFPAIGRETVVIGTLAATRRSPEAWTAILIHELFHVHAATLGLHARVARLEIGPPDDGQWQLTWPFPYENGKVRAAAGHLATELAGALANPQDGSRIENLHAALQSLRETLDPLDPKHWRYFRFVTTKEGMARWFETRLVRHLAAMEQGSATGGLDFAALARTAYPRSPGQLPSRDTPLSRLDFYAIGMALALILDQTAPDWPLRYAAEDIWLDQLLSTPVSGISFFVSYSQIPPEFREKID
jgi:hypothetical protein